jgi:hypothetical protein
MGSDVMGNILLMIANYFHDLSVALLATNVLAVYYVGRYLDDNPVSDAIIPHLFAKLSRITWWAFGYVIAGGALRAWFFMDFEWNPAVGRGQIAALVVKHILLVTITIMGIIWHMRYQRKYGRQT